jgi:hypothetical protein
MALPDMTDVLVDIRFPGEDPDIQFIVVKQKREGSEKASLSLNLLKYFGKRAY